MSDVSPPAAEGPVTRAVLEAVLKAELERYATKADLERFVTKDDLKAELERFVTKDDLKAELEPLRTAIAALPTLEQIKALPTLEQIKALPTLEQIKATNQELLGVYYERHLQEFGALNDVDKTLEGRIEAAEGSLNTVQTIVDAHRENTAIHVRPHTPRPKRAKRARR
jgi:hypothetical protein